MRCSILALTVAAMCVLFVSVSAQPTIVSYQGALLKNGGPFDRDAEFKFAILCGGVIVWNSDSGSPQNGNPSASVTISVDRGVFSAMLGDVSKGMPSLTSTLLDGCTTPLLRVWVDTSGGFEQLVPDQPFGSSAFALMSERANTGGSGPDNDWVVNGSRMYSAVSGNVGIGITAPTAKLHVENFGLGIPGASIFGENTSTGSGIAFVGVTHGTDGTMVLIQEGSGSIFRGFNGGCCPVFEVHNNGKVTAAELEVTQGTFRVTGSGGVNVLGDTGTGTASPAVRAENTNTGSGIAFFGQTHGSDATAVFTQVGTGDILLGFNGGCCPVFTVTNSGKVITPVLEITGGSDIAEPFPVSEGDEIPPGALVVIDEENPGALKLSDEAYDSRVAGVVSGAGGLSPGLTLSQENVLGGGVQVALTGRVYAKATAASGAIKPGDLLTTSAIPGHAMKATDHDRSRGAVIGKAMSSLDEGTGLVLVLISLQ